MRRALISVFILVAAVCAVFGEAKKIRVGILNGPSCVPVVQMLEKSSYCDFSQYADPQALLPKLLKKEIDCGFLPANVAAKVYNSASKSVVLCAVTGNGNLKLITTDRTLRQLNDLRGKTLYVAGQGATPDYITRYLLSQNDIPADSSGGVTLSFSVPTAQIAAQLISSKIDYAVVPEPFATIAAEKSKDVIAAIDLQSEFKLLNGENADFPLTVLVVRREFARDNQKILEKFLADYKKSFEWTVSHPVQAGNLCEKHNLGLAADIVAKAIPASNYVCVSAEDARADVEKFLGILLDFSAESIGGALPEQDFYYGKTNP